MIEIAPFLAINAYRAVTMPLDLFGLGLLLFIGGFWLASVSH